jgi:hypothetical protein
MHSANHSASSAPDGTQSLSRGLPGVRRADIAGWIICRALAPGIDGGNGAPRLLV